MIVPLIFTLLYMNPQGSYSVLLNVLYYALSLCDIYSNKEEHMQFLFVFCFFILLYFAFFFLLYIYIYIMHRIQI